MQSTVHFANTRIFTFDIDLGVMVTQSVDEYPSHFVTYGPGKFEVKEVHLKENTFLDLGIKVTLNIAWHPLHHVAYSPAKFSVAMS